MTALTQVFDLQIARQQYPILVSVPHAGTDFPDAYQELYDQAILQQPPDTDWYVDELYEFATDLGLGLIRAKVSRYVVDLNRNPDGSRLYRDKRLQTSATPTSTFAGHPIFRNQNLANITAKERIKLYHKPYHAELHHQLKRMQQQFGRALLFDAHSIKRTVPSLSSQAFPDCILGNRDGQSCSKELIEEAANYLRSQGLNVSINQPFKGGHITESCYDRKQGIMTLQLEMCQDLYMDELQLNRSQDFSKIQTTLKGLMARLIEIF